MKNKKIFIFLLGVFFCNNFNIAYSRSRVEDFVDTYASNLKELREDLDVLFKKSLKIKIAEWFGLASDKDSWRMDVRWHSLELISYLEDKGRREKLNPRQIREPILNLFRLYKKPLDVYKQQLNELYDALAVVSVRRRHYHRISNEYFVVNILVDLMREVGIRI